MTTVETTVAERMGFTSGQSVLELGHNEYCDQDLRESVEAVTGSKLVKEGVESTVDAVLLWYREDDGELTDLLIDAIGALTAAGDIWLLTPKTGRTGHLEPSDIAESLPVAGLPQTETKAVGADWQGSRLVVPSSR